MMIEAIKRVLWFNFLRGIISEEQMTKDLIEIEEAEIRDLVNNGTPVNKQILYLPYWKLN